MDGIPIIPQRLTVCQSNVASHTIDKLCTTVTDSAAELYALVSNTIPDLLHATFTNAVGHADTKLLHSAHSNTIGYPFAELLLAHITIIVKHSVAVLRCCNTYSFSHSLPVLRSCNTYFFSHSVPVLRSFNAYSFSHSVTVTYTSITNTL